MTTRLDRLTVSNYRSLGPEVEFRPGSLSVLIGPNGAGKSNLLDVLSFVRDGVGQGLPAAIANRGGIDAVRRRSHSRPFDVRVEMGLSLDSGPASYGFVITGDRIEEYRVKSEWALVQVDGQVAEFRREGDQWSGPQGLAPRMEDDSLALSLLGGSKEFKPLVDFLSGVMVYAIFPDTLRRPQKFDSSRPMKRHGENWVSVLRELAKDEDAKGQLVAGLGKLTGDIEDLRVTSTATYLLAEFRHRTREKKGKRWFDAGLESDGTLRVAGLLTALLQQPALPVIAIEEPELTVHPEVLSLLADYLHQAAELSQVIITTHSPLILDVLDPDRDSIFVVDRRDGKTAVEPLTEEQLAPVRKRLLSLGDLFVMGDLQLSLFDGSAEE